MRPKCDLDGSTDRRIARALATTATALPTRSLARSPRREHTRVTRIQREKTSTKADRCHSPIHSLNRGETHPRTHARTLAAALSRAPIAHTHSRTHPRTHSCDCLRSFSYSGKSQHGFLVGSRTPCAMTALSSAQQPDVLNGTWSARLHATHARPPHRTTPQRSARRAAGALRRQLSLSRGEGLGRRHSTRARRLRAPRRAGFCMGVCV